MSRRTKIALLIAALLFIILYQLRQGPVERRYKGLLGDVLNPVVYYFDKVSSGVSNIWLGYVYLVDLKKTNDLYFDKIAELMLENSLLKENLTKFEQLEELVTSRKPYSFDTIPANVIGRNIDGYLKYVIIDMGANEGVSLKDSVLSHNGLAGRIGRVHSHSSEVTLILDINNNISVMNDRTRTVGILKGDGRGGVHIDYYDRLDDAKEGDVIITSGLGGVYPKGIPIGTILEVDVDSDGMFKKIKVEHNVDFYKLENVLVVTDNKQ